MRYKDEQELAAALGAGEGHGAYFLYGPEPYLIELWARRLSGAADASPFNFQRFDGAKPDVHAIRDAVDALPLMAERKCVRVDSLETGALAARLPDFEQMLGDLPASTLLVVTAKSPGFDEKSAAGKKLLALMDRAGAVVRLGPRDRAGLTRYIKQAAQQNGCEWPGELCRYLLDLCDNDMHALRGEIDKVCAFAGGGVIRREHIDAVVIPKTEARVFDLQKKLLRADAAGALGLLACLFELREQPVAISAALAMGFCDLYRARAARDGGAGLDELIRALGYKGREFRAKRAWTDCAKIPAQSLRRMLLELLRCDADLKRSPADPRILLETTALRLIALVQEAR